MRPESLALRPNTQPPHARIAPVTDFTSRLGSTREIALICIAHGIGPCRVASRMKEACRTSGLSAELAGRMKLCKSGTVEEAGQGAGISDRLIHRMILGSGIDLVEIERIRQSMERFGSRFLDRVFTAAEQAYCLRKRNAAESLAARFAAKEAAAKALGTGISHGVSWLEIEVIREPGGRPSIQFQGRAAEIAEQMGVAHVALSLTHTASLAMASVTVED